MKTPYLLDTTRAFATKRLAITSVVASLVLFCFGVAAQEATPSYRSTALDPTPCFSQILQDKRVSFTHDEFTLAMLSQWSYESYDSLKAGGKLNAVVEDIPVGASYDQATVAVKRMFEKRSLNIEQSSAQAVWDTRLDPAAKEIMLACLHQMSVNRLGLATDYRLIDERKAILYLHWSWIDDSKLSVVTKSIHNATVDGDHPDQLLPPAPYLHAIFDPSMGSEAVVELTRKEPDDDIDITIETKPNVKPAIIKIPGLPKKVKCETTYPTVDETGMQQSLQLGPFDTSAKQYEVRDLGNAHHTWLISSSLDQIPKMEPDSKITQVSCSLYGTLRGWMSLPSERVAHSELAFGLSSGCG